MFSLFNICNWQPMFTLLAPQLQFGLQGTRVTRNKIEPQEVTIHSDWQKSTAPVDMSHWSTARFVSLYIALFLGRSCVCSDTLYSFDAWTKLPLLPLSLKFFCTTFQTKSRMQQCNHSRGFVKLRSIDYMLINMQWRADGAQKLLTVVPCLSA